MASSERDGTHVVVVSGARPIHPAATALLPRDAVIVAADSGWDRAIDIGLKPHVLVGDMDSISRESLHAAEASSSSVVRHPAEKDFTDVELALVHAAHLGDRITLLSGGGGRLDQAFGELTALTNTALAACHVDAVIGTARIHAISSGQSRHIDAPVHSIVSVLVVGEAATGVTLTGCRWNLHDATLTAHECRGMSNAVDSPPAIVSVRHGSLLVIEPFYIVDEGTPR